MASRCKTDFDLLNLIKETSSPRSVVSTCPTSLSGGTTVEQTRLAGKTTKDETTANLTDLPSDNPERIEEAIDMPDTTGVDIKSSTSNSCQYSTDLETSNSTSENGDYCLSSSLSCEKYAKSDNLPEMQVTEPIQDFSNVDIKCDIVKNDDGAGAAPSLPKEIDTKLGISKIIAVKNKIPKGNVEDGMIRDQDLWCLSKEELVAELRSCREQVVSLQKQLSKSERQVKKADDYNEVLRSSLEKVSSQVHNYKTAKFTEAAIQVDKMDLLNYTTGELCMPDWGSDNVNMDTEALQSDSYHSVEDQTQNLASDEAPMSLADSIKMAAQEALNKQTQDTMLLQGYVFDENYGLYYHSESGYYYDQEKQLYYDPNSGIYYYYDYNTGQYAFHSQVSSFAGDAFTAYRETDTTFKKVNQKKAGKKPKKIRKLPSSEERQKVSTGLMECISSLEDLKLSKESRLAREAALEVAQSWPPCVRVIVTESDFVAVGMLYIVTYQGTTIGREKDNGICIPDINISKCHAEIRFAENDNMFTIIDKGSQNGTFLNEERISKPKQTSEAKAFKHGDVLQVAGTKLLCHIHSGTDTCDECEPGIVMAKYRQQLPKQEVKFISKEERKKIQKKELNEIKKRYGLKNAAFEVRSDVLNNPNYEDKAAERRKTVGSDVSTVVKEAPASVFRPISSENKGHKMLEKMGWKEGESLGKDNSGIQEPIAVSLRVNQSAGLGSASAGIFSPEDANSVDVRKANRRIRAMQRYDVLETTERVANQLSEQIVQMTEDNVSSAIKKLPEKYKMTWSKGDTENT